MTTSKHIGVALLGLLICLLWFDRTPTDLWIQKLFFDTSNFRWVWDSHEPLGRLILRSGLKMLLMSLGAGLFVALVATRWYAGLKPYRRGLRIAVLSLILVPASVAGLKLVTDIPCPRDLVLFGGDIPYRGLLGLNGVDAQAFAKQRCFPAGHASGGFALLSLSFLFGTSRNRKAAIAAAMLVGWTMGVYKMAIGDHFLSHTVITMILAWLIIQLVAAADRFLSADSPPQLQTI